MSVVVLCMYNEDILDRMTRIVQYNEDHLLTSPNLPRDHLYRPSTLKDSRPFDNSSKAPPVNLPKFLRLIGIFVAEMT